MANFTENFELEKPIVDDPAYEDVWGEVLNENFDKIDAAVYAASLNQVPVYQWTRSLNAGRWSGHSLSVTNENGALRFTNDAGTGDASISMTVPPGRDILIRASTSDSSGMGQDTPEMHLGNAANPYGGYGFDYPVNEDILLQTTDDGLTIYVVTREGAAGDWVEFEDVTVMLVESGQRITASATPPPNPSQGDVWIDLS